MDGRNCSFAGSIYQYIDMHKTVCFSLSYPKTIKLYCLEYVTIGHLHNFVILYIFY